LETEQVIRSRDALWLNQQYRVWKGIAKQTITNIHDDELFINTIREKAQDIEAGRGVETNVDRIKIVDNLKTMPIRFPPNLHEQCKNLEDSSIQRLKQSRIKFAPQPSWLLCLLQSQSINQSGREYTANVLIDQFDEDFVTISDFAFLVAEVEKNLSLEQMKTGAADETHNKMSPAGYNHVSNVPANVLEEWDHPDPWN
jgi:hypothetical protein